MVAIRKKSRSRGVPMIKTQAAYLDDILMGVKTRNKQALERYDKYIDLSKMDKEFQCLIIPEMLKGLSAAEVEPLLSDEKE